MANDEICIVCHARGATARQIPIRSAFREWDCERCGSYEVNVVDEECLREAFDDLLRAKIKYFVLNAARKGEQRPVLTSDLLSSLSARELPAPAEVVENMLEFVGDSLRHRYGQSVTLTLMMSAQFGAATQMELRWILENMPSTLIMQSRLPHSPVSMETQCQLTFEGWARYREIKSRGVNSRRAFMAMPFGTKRVVDAFERIFRPAVAAAGFELVKVADHPRAGLIDDQIMVDIRNSRFVVADLTEENRGAYWESGFAEGLGKPVIYTCDRAWFEKEKTHFDTNHRNTVLWDLDAPDDARARLTAAVRNTLPGEARMTESRTERG